MTLDFDGTGFGAAADVEAVEVDGFVAVTDFNFVDDVDFVNCVVTDESPAERVS